MTMIGVGPVFDMLRKQAAEQKAQEDSAYEKERRRLAKMDDLVDGAHISSGCTIPGCPYGC